MMMVRVILVDTTRPFKMRPRIETLPVKGHFLSAAQDQTRHPKYEHTSPASR
jgi:hypothetical protein